MQYSELRELLGLFLPCVFSDIAALISKIISKCMHGMNQTEAEYSSHGKRSQRASLSQIDPVVLEVYPDIYCACAQ